MPKYSAEAYLLDHTHIQSTLHKLYTFVDTAQFPRLASSEVFNTPTFKVDYSAMFGGSHSITSPQDVVEKNWQPMMSKMVATQHTMSCVLVEGLPAPGSETTAAVTEATATAYVTARLSKRKSNEDGRPGQGLISTSNGGIGSYRLVKVDETHLRKTHGDSWDGNPWRVSEMKVVPKWYEGHVEEVLGKVVPL